MARDTITPLSEPIFNEGSVTPDPARFKIEHPSATELYKEIQSLLTKDVVGFKSSRLPPEGLFTLEEACGSAGPQIVKKITTAGKIVFHAAGDTGASNERKYGNEIRVADQLASDCRTADEANRPSFLFQLGDVVYDFGESKYYYDQFYDPFRNYPAPIFAIPGNHDSFVIPNTPPGSTPLDIFERNFCSDQPVITPEAASLHRTAMTQPGVYFTLDAPYVRIIALFSNALEDPGVISSEDGKWQAVPDDQLAFLTAQFNRIKKDKFSGAVVLATHHPPFSYSAPKKLGGASGNHSSSSAMLRQIDNICLDTGIYPHAFLSGHAHNYQRFARTIEFGNQKYEVPFIVCGDGGHNVNPLVKARKGQPAHEPHFGDDVFYLEMKPAVKSLALVLKQYDDVNYGYLRVTVDKDQLRIGFHSVGTPLPQSRVDMVTVDLASHTVVAN